MAFDLSTYYTEFGGAKGHIFRRNYFYPCDKDLPQRTKQFRQEYQNTDCFQCLYRYSTMEEGALLYAPFYLDLDADITTDSNYHKIRPYIFRAYLFFKDVLKLEPEEIGLYFSGSKGFHITIDPRVLGIIPSTDLNAVYKAWALHLTAAYQIPVIDLKIYDKRRLFRMPNTINSKTGLYKVPLRLEQLVQFSYEELLNYAKMPKLMRPGKTSINKRAALLFYERSKKYKNPITKPRQEPAYEIPQDKQELLPCIKTILEEGAILGARNNTLIILASGLFQAGYKQNEVEAMVLQWNQIVDPPLKETELYATIHSAYTMLQNGRRYGCSSIKEMGLCSSNECRIGEAQ